MPIKVGDTLPSVDLFDGTPDVKVNIDDICKGKVVLFGLPGAYTPTCSADHVPGFVKSVEDFKKKGVTGVYCISINDPYVMAAWGKTMDPTGKIRFLADTNGAFTKTLDLTVDLTPLLGSVRSKRYAMVVENMKVKWLVVEPDSVGLTCSRGADLLKLL